MLSYLVSVLALTAVLLPHAAPQTTDATPDGSIGDCSAAEVTGFVARLPNAFQCGLGLRDFFMPGNRTSAELQTQVDAVCTVDCGASLAIYGTQSCNDIYAGITLLLYCLPTGEETGLNRCRYSVPDLLDQDLINNLESCAGYEEGACPIGCADALTSFIGAVGCCYKSLYADPSVRYGFVFTELLTVDQFYLIGNLTRPVWSACAVAPPDFCVGDPFPGESQLAVGVCTADQVNNFISGLSDECSEAYGVAYNPGSDSQAIENAFDDICTTGCGKRVSEWERTRCFAPISAEVGTAICYSADAELGDRCSLTVSQNLTNAPFFVNVGSSCLAFDPSTDQCPAGCASALRVLSDQLDCCYQTLYNNTNHLNLFSFEELISIEDRFFFEFINQQVLWDACEVPLVPECTGDPYPAGAIKFAASSVVILLASVFISFL